MKKNNLTDNLKVEEIRINKFISEKGVCSRREADRLISLGKVTINGEVATMGSKVTSTDEVKLEGKLLSKKPKQLYIALNKPKGIVSTTDPKEKNNIVNFINYPERIFHIGRLDKDSEGLIFLTNDGDIVNKILRAGNNHEKEYIVTVDKPLTQDFLQRMCSGVRILGTVTKPCKIYKEGSNVFRIILTQGLNRQIRRMCQALGYTVTKLKRIRIMNVKLDNLPLGKWRYLTSDEINTINELLKNSTKTEEASK